MPAAKPVLIVLTEGKSDNGRKATVAFSVGVTARAQGAETTIFLTSEAAVWGYEGSGAGIASQGFAPLSELIQTYLETDGKIMLCSTCWKTCGSGSPLNQQQHEVMPGVKIAGLSTVVELADQSTCLTF